jgi:hypothetical protein
MSCLMGYSYPYAGLPRMCFNAHKNYVLGWYADKQISVDPSVTGAWSGKLVGFVDYEKAATSRGEYVLIVVGNYYIQFNLAEGYNSETQEKGNMVTIATASRANAVSNMVSGLSATNRTTLGSYTIDVCAMVQATATNPKYMLMSIRLTTSQSSTCPKPDVVSTPRPSTRQPTASPTSLPISNPPRDATLPPTQPVMPTVVPTSNPTRTPTVQSPKPVAQAYPPTIKPTRKPTLQPTKRRRSGTNK